MTGIGSALMKQLRFSLLLTVVVLALPASASANLPRGDYVGFVGKGGATRAFGVVVGGQGVLAYACNGKTFGTWFKGKPPAGRAVTLRKGSARLGLRKTATGFTVTFRGKTTTLRRAKGKPGLYRSENRRGTRQKLGGWIVLLSRKVIGGVTSGTTFNSGPTFNVSSGVAGTLTAAQVISPADPGPVVLDLDDDGIDVDQTVTSSAVTGSPAKVNWTQAGDDDAFIGLSASALQAAGFRLAGPGSTGFVLARGGLQITHGGVTTTTVDGFHLLRLLDSNGDGRLSVIDPAWDALRGLRDANADGDFGDTPGLGGSDMVAKMAAMNMEFLALQNATQAESRKFQTLSNASKARHDIAMNAINALRG
jgi:hypothetical protein